MQKLRRILNLTVVAIVGAAIVFISPLVALLAAALTLVLLAVTRQLNLYKIVMIMKGYAKNLARIRSEIHAKLHSGFYDHSAQADQESHSQSCSCIR
jgi:hypothetical protein